MGMFAGKKGLITGVFNKQSIAWSIAERIMSEGGECGFSYMPDKPDDTRQKNLGRLKKLTDGNSQVKFLQPMDVTNDEHIAAVMDCCRNELGKIDFLLHSIAFALPDDLKGDTIATSRAGFKLAMEISAYSLIALSNAAQEVLNDEASILTLTYFGGEKAVPGYNVMGICKAALDSAVKYLAYDLGPRGIRVNALSAGPVANHLRPWRRRRRDAWPLRRHVATRTQHYPRRGGQQRQLPPIDPIVGHHRRNPPPRRRLQRDGLARAVAGEIPRGTVKGSAGVRVVNHA